MSSGTGVIEAAPSVSVALVDKQDAFLARTSTGLAGADELCVVMDSMTEFKVASATITLTEAKLEVSRTAITVKLCTNQLFNSLNGTQHALNKTYSSRIVSDPQAVCRWVILEFREKFSAVLKVL